MKICIYLSLDILYILYIHVILFESCTVGEIDKKIKNIRTQYIRERGRRRKSKSGQGVKDVYEPKWAYFKSLQLLDDFVVGKQSHSNLQVTMSCCSAMAQSHDQNLSRYIDNP